MTTNTLLPCPACKPNSEYAARAIGMILLVLKDKYTDEQIMNFLKPDKVREMLNVLANRGQPA